MKKPKTGMFERDEVREHQEQVQGKKKAAICPPVRRKVEAGRAQERGGYRATAPQPGGSWTQVFLVIQEPSAESWYDISLGWGLGRKRLPCLC